MAFEYEDYFATKFNKRALRRWHELRLFQKRKGYWGGAAVPEYKQIDDLKMKRVVNTPKPCSCFMCGNPRKHYKEKTKQELMWLEKAKEQIGFLT